MALVGGGTRPLDRPRLEPERLTVVTIDLGLMFVVPAMVALSQVERFRVDGAGLLVDAADQVRIDEIDQGFHRAVELGDHLYVLSALGWWGALVALVVSSWTIVVAFPPAAGGRTPGAVVVGRLAARARLDDRIVRPARRGAGTDAGDEASAPARLASSPAIAGLPSGELRPTGRAEPPTIDLVEPRRRAEPETGADVDGGAGDRPGGDRVRAGTIDLATPEPIAPPRRPVRPAPRRSSAAEAPPPHDPRRSWLGDADDYRQWETAGGRWGDGAPAGSPAFDELVLPESSLGDGISAVTADAVARAIEPWPGR